MLRASKGLMRALFSRLRSARRKAGAALREFRFLLGEYQPSVRTEPPLCPKILLPISAVQRRDNSNCRVLPVLGAGALSEAPCARFLCVSIQRSIDGVNTPVLCCVAASSPLLVVSGKT